MEKTIRQKYTELLPGVRKVVDDLGVAMNITRSNENLEVKVIQYDHREWAKRKRPTAQQNRFFSKHAENIALAALIASVIYLNTLVEYILF